MRPALCAFFVLASACDAPPPPPPVSPPPPLTDAGPRVTPPRRDGGGGGTTGPRTPLTRLACATVAEPRVIGEDRRATVEAPATIATDAGFVLAWTELRAGAVGLFVNALSPDGVVRGEVGGGSASLPRAPALLTSGAGYRLFYTEHTGDGFDLRARAIDPDLTASEVAAALTRSPDEEERQVAALEHGDGALLAWVARDARSGAGAAYLARLGSDGEMAATPVGLASPDGPPTTVRLLRADAGPVAVLGDARVGHVWAQRVTDDGAASGEPVLVSGDARASGSVDAAWGIAGGAVIFGAPSDTRPTLRFRALDPDGAPFMDLRSVGAGPRGEADASVASVGGGYVVGYRALGDDPERAEIRLATLSESGLPLDDLAIAESSREGGPVLARATASGHVALVWVERTATGTTLRATVLSCVAGAS